MRVNGLRHNQKILVGKSVDENRRFHLATMPLPQWRRDHSFEISAEQFVWRANVEDYWDAAAHGDSRTTERIETLFSDLDQVIVRLRNARDRSCIQGAVRPLDIALFVSRFRELVAGEEGIGVLLMKITSIVHTQAFAWLEYDQRSRTQAGKDDATHANSQLAFATTLGIGREKILKQARRACNLRGDRSELKKLLRLIRSEGNLYRDFVEKAWRSSEVLRRLERFG